MKLDRNINPDGKGKYALLRLRTIQRDGLARTSDEVLSWVDKLEQFGYLDFGDTPDTDFFVIRIKDKYAGPALHAYAQAALADDPEYAAEVDALAQAADRRLPKRKPD